MDTLSQRYFLSISVKLIISIGAALAATLIPYTFLSGLACTIVLAGGTIQWLHDSGIYTGNALGILTSSSRRTPR